VLNEEARELWTRATKALDTASLLVDQDPDAAVSRAYYAAYYAVSAFFATEGKTFTKHRAVESAVHRDLVNTRIWPEELGKSFSLLVQARYTADYGGKSHATKDSASHAVQQARAILAAVHTASPLTAWPGP